MKKFRVIPLVCVLCLVSAQPMAESVQRIVVQEDVRIKARIATQALNQIRIENDRILNIRALPGTFELETDTELGHIFIKPLASSEVPLGLFLSTESGKSYGLELSLEQTHSGASIVLVPPSDTLPQESDYLSELVTCIRALHRGEPPAGLSQSSVHHSIQFSKTLKGHIVAVYQGSSFKAEILELQNVGSTALSLTALDLYQDSVSAISIVEPFLPPKARTRVYWVKS